jgi:hypothetical protein
LSIRRIYRALPIGWLLMQARHGLRGGWWAAGMGKVVRR